MKKTNKGFSMVELIIVIAIMAILAGALAPALIKYINKSRISTDIQTANTIATGVQTALANETGYDDAQSIFTTSSTWVDYDSVAGGTTTFASLLKDTVGKETLTLKSKKCTADDSAGPTSYTNAKFEIALDGNSVFVRESVANHNLYPTASTCLTDGGACTP